MNNATIKGNADRPASLAYDGQKCKIIRKVDKDDRAWNDKQPQVLVLIGDKELYFYADEVIEDKAPAVKLVSQPKPPEPKPPEPKPTPPAPPRPSPAPLPPMRPAPPPPTPVHPEPIAAHSEDHHE